MGPPDKARSRGSAAGPARDAFCRATTNGIAESGTAARAVLSARNKPSLARQVFKTSRLAEFCSRKELVNQTGHAVKDWPFVVLKELVDNALDSAEEAWIAPVIEISVSQDGITVADNGPGIAPETITDILDYGSRVSSREAYASPTRGAQGNALKTLLAMPFALDGQIGETTIESRDVAHRISFSTDRLRQTPRINRVCEASSVRTGTRITVRWPNSAFAQFWMRQGLDFYQSRRVTPGSTRI